jgi:hypothetical protein
LLNKTIRANSRQKETDMTSPNLSERAAAERNANNERMVHADFDMAPFTIAWEVTRRAYVAHCRADAQHTARRELSTLKPKH